MRLSKIAYAAGMHTKSHTPVAQAYVDDCGRVCSMTASAREGKVTTKLMTVLAFVKYQDAPPATVMATHSIPPKGSVKSVVSMPLLPNLR